MNDWLARWSPKVNNANNVKMTVQVMKLREWFIG